MTFTELANQHTSHLLNEKFERLCVTGIYVKMYQLEIEGIPQFSNGMEKTTLSTDNDISHSRYFQYFGDNFLRIVDLVTMDNKTHAVELLVQDKYSKPKDAPWRNGMHV